LVGPLKETPKGNKYIIVATEYLLRWPEAQALPDKSAEGVHQFLMSLVSRFGACCVLLHDQGKEFNNATINTLCDQLKIAVAMTSAYHPQTNGYVYIPVLIHSVEWIRRGLFLGVRYAAVSIFGVFVRQAFPFST